MIGAARRSGPRERIGHHQSGRERALRFASYAATLDQEQKTATAYADAVTELERFLQPSKPSPNETQMTDGHVRHGLQIERPSDLEAEPVEA